VITARPVGPPAAVPNTAENYRHHTEQLDRALEAVLARAGKSRVTAVLVGFDAATHAVDQVHQRNAITPGKIFNETALPALAPPAAGARAALDGAILAAHRDRTPVDFADARHIGMWRE